MNDSQNGFRKDSRHADWPRHKRVIDRDQFKCEVHAWARRIGVEVNELHIRSMKRKWGSCSTTGRVTFDAELLAAPAAFRREVIVHELLHFRVPNHGKVFRALLKAYLAMDVAACIP